MIICFEGADRLGKTTQAKLLAEKLNCEYIKFPNEKLFSGQRIRAILNGEFPFEPASFQALQTINKLESVQHIKLANSQKGNVVLDRYSMSCIVYGLADGLPELFVYFTADQLPVPDITFLFKGEPFSKDNDIYGEKEHQKLVSELYENMFEDYNGHIKRVNANFEKETLSNSIYTYCRGFSDV